MRATSEGKRCSVCKETKPVSEFWKDRHRSDGLTIWCKVCRKEYVRKQYSLKKLQLKRQLEPLKYKARSTVTNMLRAGKITREPCFLCGVEKTQAHHLNYNYPEKVVWLCNQHHGDIHNELSA